MKLTSLRPGWAPVEFRMADHVIASGAWRSGWRICILTLLLAAVAPAAGVTFEDLNLPPESYWKGADGSGGFASGEAFFANNYTAAWDSWDGFAYSNRTDVHAADWQEGQYNAIVGSGQGGSSTYAVGYVGWVQSPTITFPTPCRLQGLYVTNTTYGYYALRDGAYPARPFGSARTDPNWFLLSITGKNAAGKVTGKVDFYLADFRFPDTHPGYLVDSWQLVCLTSLGEVKTLEFALSSNDIDPVYGMNTPAYFCLDTIIPATQGGPYVEPGVNGYIDPATWRQADPLAPQAVLNPIFRGWAAKVVEYSPADGTLAAAWKDPSRALGPATGQNTDIVSLGELTRQDLDQGRAPGSITLAFGGPDALRDGDAIRNGKGYDFVVFENGFTSQATTAAGSRQDQMLAELAYVEVSTNGRDFARFPCVSLASGPVGAYGTIEMSNVHNLAGKHLNAGGICTGTPFDLAELASHPAVVSGTVDLNDIRYVRIVDIPGSGDFYDEAAACIAPGTGPQWAHYTANHPVYDMWPTWGSGGFDLEAVGVLREQELSADINLDGIVDDLDLAALNSAWHCRFGDEHWNGRCDLAEPRDLCIDDRDLAVVQAQWGHVERWRAEFPGK